MLIIIMAMDANATTVLSREDLKTGYEAVCGGSAVSVNNLAFYCVSMIGLSQTSTLPPVTSRVTLVNREELFEASNRVPSATPSGASIRPSGNEATHCCC
jgi:hypothetical protein